MAEGFDLTKLDNLWYHELQALLPSGSLRSIARFAFGILKEMAKLSIDGRREFPHSSKGYVLEKVICIVERADLQRDIMLEIARYWSPEQLEAVFKEAMEMAEKETG